MPDINLKSWANTDGMTVIGPILFDGRGDSDSFKLSNSTNFTASNIQIIGGNEDCIDVNRGANISLTKMTLTPSGTYAMTCKGGVKNLLLEAVIMDHGSEVDIDLDNWSDQSPDPCSGIVLNARMFDGSAVRVRSWRGCIPTYVDGSGPYEFDAVPWFISVPFFGYKRFLRWWANHFGGGATT